MLRATWLSVLLTFACDGAIDPGRDEMDASATHDAGSDGGPEPADAAAEDAAPAIDAGPAGDCARLGSWGQSAPLPDGPHVTHPLPSFARGGWFWVHTMAEGGGDRVLYAARAEADGSLGPWQEASGDHGGGPHGFTAVVAGGDAYHFRNGHIARYPLSGDGRMTGDVELLEESTDAAFGGERWVWDSAVAVPLGPGWVVHLGGFSFTPYEYRRTVTRDSLPLGPRFEAAGLDHPAARPGKSAFVADGPDSGWIFTAESGGARLFRAAVDADGTVGTFAELAALPDGTDNQRGDLFSVDRTLFAVRGAKVFAADVAGDGALGAWRAMPDLPAPQVDVTWGDGHLEGAAFGLIGDHVYLTGPARVFHAAVSRGLACE